MDPRAGRDDSAQSPIVVLIVNFHSSAHLGTCLASLRDERVDRVLILENGSSEAEWQALTALSAGDQRVELFRSRTNLGFAGGMNFLFAQGRPSAGAVLWLLNPDTIVSAGAGRALAESLAASGYAIVSPRIDTGQDPPRAWFDHGTVDRRTGRTRETLRHARPPDGEGSVEECDYVTGAAMVLRSSTFQALGGFDERLFLYWEDVDLSIRARERGLRVGVDLAVTVWHFEGASSKSRKSTRSMIYFYVSRNRILVCRPHGRRGLGLIAGPGTIAMMRLIAHALVRGGGGRCARAAAVIRGALTAAGQPSFQTAGSLAPDVADSSI